MVSSAITFISSQQRICLFSQPVHDVAFIFWLLWTKRKLVFIFVKLLLHRNFFKMQINDQIMRVWKSSCFCKAKLLQGCDNSKKGEKKYKSLFSCEAQLNTCTCVLSVRLSVCPSVIKLNFSLFGHLMTAYDNLWQLMTTYDNLWQLMTAYDSLWQLITADNSWWQLLATFGNFWQLLRAFESFWQLLKAYDTSSWGS